MHRLFFENDGPLVHKWVHYLSIYDRHLSRFREMPVRLLEIGIFRGGSMCLWRRYFGNAAVIFGIDIDPQCAEFNGKYGKVRIGSQANPEFLRNVVTEMGGVDIIIDDGSHNSLHQKVSFETLFPLLDANGVYICEDLHTSYWRGHHLGGYRRRSSFIETMKNVIDDLHADFHRRSSYVEGASRMIDGLHFYNSMIVVEKRPQHRPAHLMVGGKTNHFGASETSLKE
jgi:hypothetical protein